LWIIISTVSSAPSNVIFFSKTDFLASGANLNFYVSSTVL
jgi:hypothetical protein